MAATRPLHNLRTRAGSRSQPPEQCTSSPPHRHPHPPPPVQKLGIRVVRAWAFNDQMPSAPGVYSEAQFQGLDYVVQSARRHNMKLVSSCAPLRPRTSAVPAGPRAGLLATAGYPEGRALRMLTGGTPTVSVWRHALTGCARRSAPPCLPLPPAGAGAHQLLERLHRP